MLCSRQVDENLFIMIEVPEVKEGKPVVIGGTTPRLSDKAVPSDRLVPSGTVVADE